MFGQNLGGWGGRGGLPRAPLFDFYILLLFSLILFVQHVKLVNGSTATNQFLQSSAPLYSEYYFFNITNPKEILDGATPHVKQVGPFVYR